MQRPSERNHRADRLALVHQIEGVVDLLQRHDMRDQLVDLDLAVHVPIDDRRPGGGAAGAAERRTFPHPPGDQLERSGLDLLPRSGDADDDRHTPATVAALERLAHEIDVTDALEAVIGTAVGEAHQVLYQVPAELLGVHEVGHAEALGERFAARVDIHADDLARADQARALDDVQPNAPQAEHHYVRARLDLGRVDDRADAGRDAAADVADLLEGRVLADLGERSEEHTSELQSQSNLVCRLLLEKKKD